MKYCPQCGSSNEDNAGFCLSCGSTIAPSAPAPGQAAGGAALPSTPSRKAGGSIVAIGIILALALAAAAFYFLYWQPTQEAKSYEEAVLEHVEGLNDDWKQLNDLASDLYDDNDASFAVAEALLTVKSAKDHVEALEDLEPPAEWESEHDDLADGLDVLNDIENEAMYYVPELEEWAPWGTDDYDYYNSLEGIEESFRYSDLETLEKAAEAAEDITGKSFDWDWSWNW